MQQHKGMDKLQGQQLVLTETFCLKYSWFKQREVRLTVKIRNKCHTSTWQSLARFQILFCVRLMAHYGDSFDHH